MTKEERIRIENKVNKNCENTFNLTASTRELCENTLINCNQINTNCKKAIAKYKEAGMVN